MRFIAVISLALALGGCELVNDLGAITGEVSGASVSATTVTVAAKSFDSLQLLAASYLGLKICTATNRPICREKAATPIINGAIQSGRIARNALKKQLRTACAAQFAQRVPCTAGIPVASYNTLVAATGAISDATSAYRAATNQ